MSGSIWCWNSFRQRRERGERQGKKRWVVFHEWWLSEAVLSAHRYQLTTREGKGQQRTSNRGGIELWVGGGKAQHSENLVKFINVCLHYHWVLENEGKKGETWNTEHSNITQRWRFMRTKGKLNYDSLLFFCFLHFLFYSSVFPQSPLSLNHTASVCVCFKRF